MSGLSRTPGKRVWANPHRGFESRPLRQMQSPSSPLLGLFCFDRRLRSEVNQLGSDGFRLRAANTPLTSTTSGMPRASTTMCRLEPSLPLSVGLGPVSWPPGGLGTDERRCSPGSNRSGRAHAGAPAWRGAVSATPRQRSSLAAAANTSYHGHSRIPAASPPRRCRCAARTECH